MKKKISSWWKAPRRIQDRGRRASNPTPRKEHCYGDGKKATSFRPLRRPAPVALRTKNYLQYVNELQRHCRLIVDIDALTDGDCESNAKTLRVRIRNEVQRILPITVLLVGSEGDV